MLTRSKSVTDQLRVLLLEGNYLPGTHLQEIHVAEVMGVSRTPVRAALATLEREGLLSYTPKRGYEVRRFSLDEVMDNYRIRAVLEGNAAAMCAMQGLSDELLAELSDCLQTGDAILKGGTLKPEDLPAYREMNRRFHSAVIQGSGSMATADIVERLEHIPFLSDRIILWDDFGLIHRSHDDHHRAYDAIRSRDPIRAEAIMREHVHFMGTVVIQFLEQNSEDVLRFGGEE
jgi:GntR family transcriptional regulator, vanillate catabolism transcriptional regulator